MTDERLHKGIRAISALLYVIAFVMLGGAPALFLIRGPSSQNAGILVLLGIALAVFSFLVARSLRKLRPWARTAAIVLSALGLLAFPFGTAIYGPFLYILIRAKHLFAHQPPPDNAPATAIDRLAA